MINASLESGEGDVRVEVESSDSFREMTLLYVPSSLFPGERFSSAVIDIQLVDSRGSEINRFSSSAKVCFSSTLAGKEDVCLAYFNEKSNKWECEDACLSKENDMFWFVFYFLSFFSLESRTYQS